MMAHSIDIRHATPPAKAAELLRAYNLVAKNRTVCSLPETGQLLIDLSELFLRNVDEFVKTGQPELADDWLEHAYGVYREESDERRAVLAKRAELSRLGTSGLLGSVPPQGGTANTQGPAGGHEPDRPAGLPYQEGH